MFLYLLAYVIKMLNKKSQSSGITVIIAAVIGLIIMVVLIALLTGKLGNFGKGVDNSATCQNTCNAMGRAFTDVAKGSCGAIFVDGKFKDVSSGCCCVS